MRKTTMFGMAAMLALTAVTLEAPPLRAQSAEDATMLEARASELAQDARTFEEASELYRKVAKMHEGRLESAQAYAEAARLAYYSGMESRALTDFIQAGNTAMTYGDVAVAAKAYADAAWVAWRIDRPWVAKDFGEKAEKLGHSPLLTEEEREQIARRITQATGD